MPNIWIRFSSRVFARYNNRPLLLNKMPPYLPTSGTSNYSSSIMHAEDDIAKIFLDLEQLDTFLFRSRHLLAAMPTRVYGGLVVGQSLVAALETVPNIYHVHSLHCYFLRAGDVYMPILYQVKPVRDSRHFCTRYVKAIQEGINIFSCLLSFHMEEESDIIHQAEMPKLKTAEECKEAIDILREFIDRKDADEKSKKMIQARIDRLPTTFDMRPEDDKMFLFLKPEPPKMRLYIKSKGIIGPDLRMHHCVAAYISDVPMVSTALLPYLPFKFGKDVVASLDHSIWFHKPNFAIDDWMLYETESDVAAGGRVFIKGRLWSRDGTLTMSTAQEVLFRRTKI